VPALDQFKPDLEHQVVLASHGVAPGTFYALSFINGGGLNLRWFRDNFGGVEKKQADELDKDIYQIFDEMAKEVPPGAGQSLFIPHLQGRVLPPDSSLRWLWVGFTWAHSRAYLFRAILEAVAYEYAYYLEIEKKLHPTLNFKEVRAIGGGSFSQLWNQIKSDVLNLPYCRVNRAVNEVFPKQEILLGAGTVLDAETARMAVLAGARFIVSPGFNPDVVKLCNRYQIVSMQGCMTVTEIITAMEAGADVIKFFPGDAFGPSIIKALKGPLPQAGFIPTGGVSLDNVEQWIANGCVAVGVGGELTRGAKTGDYALVAETARAFIERVQAARR